MTAIKQITNSLSVRITAYTIISFFFMALMVCQPGASPAISSLGQAHASTLDARGSGAVSPDSSGGPLVAGDEFWDDRFFLNGLNGDVYAIVISNGSVYAGGRFTTAGSCNTCNHIARWDGTTWNALGSGVNGDVYAIGISGNSVYVGGGFTTAGGVTANNVAVWNGSTWSSLGTGPNNGVDGPVRAIGFFQSSVYVGGDFTTAGNANANHIAIWSGSQWSPLGNGAGNGVNDTVYAIAVNGSSLYVGGNFIIAGGGSANHIAAWNGNQFSVLGPGSSNGANDTVYAIAVSGNNVYVGGNFTTSGGIAANHIARWDGIQWNLLGSGLNGIVFSLGTIGNDLYAGGSFLAAGGVTVNRITRWDGNQWNPLGSGTDGAVRAIAIAVPNVYPNVYVGGSFTRAGNKASSYFGLWNPTPLTPTPTNTPIFTNTPNATNTFTPIATATPCNAVNFTDVGTSDYFYQAVHYLYCAGVVSGYLDRTFRPYDNTTRGQIAKMVVLARGWPVHCPAVSDFSDVKTDNVFFCFIETAFERGIISGYSNGSFHPENNVTRGQLCKMVALAMGWKVVCPPATYFVDVPIGSTFYCYIATAFEHNVISGYWDGTFGPDNMATRGQISKIIYQAAIYR